ncbi:uncharacterized protein LOC130013208 [Patella vulgata]|uniref:uncharacterized protein LOC130013208 n=1 Tax=Patella vulgata TaxID=6465 RepID=UPI0024A9B14E|nr:uncharacterized protein LOC130013208 [Patella vulgata]
MEFYCKDCSVAICNTCRTPAHQDHDVLGICDYRDDVEAELKMLKDELEIKSSEFEKYVGEVNVKIGSMNESARTSCSKIDQHVQKICDIVILKGAKLKENLRKTFQEDERKMKEIVDGTNDLIGRMAKMAQNISDILIGYCMYDMVDVLPILKRQRNEWESRDLPNVHVVTSKHHTEPIDLTSLQNMVGEFRVARQTKTTLEHSFNYDVMQNKAENEWVYSPAVRLQDCSLNIRAKMKSDYSIDLGLYVNFGDGVNKSTIQYCTVNATMMLAYRHHWSNEVKTETNTFTETFTPPIGKLTWANVAGVDTEDNTACTASATVDVTMTTVI